MSLNWNSNLTCTFHLIIQFFLPILSLVLFVQHTCQVCQITADCSAGGGVESFVTQDVDFSVSGGAEGSAAEGTEGSVAGGTESGWGC